MLKEECILDCSKLVTFDIETKLITEKLDHWYLDMKKNLMNEFDKLRLRFLEEVQQNILHEKEIQTKEYICLNQDIKIMCEILIHYKNIIDQKEQTETNLCKSLNVLYNKTILYHHYYEWRIIYIEKRQQKYSLLLAKDFYEKKIKKKVLNNWKQLIEREWKKHFELIYKKKSKIILNELINRYEIKYKQLELQLLNANEEITQLKLNRNVHDETLKKSFMRGICALNMEAMSVLFKDRHEYDTITNENQQRDYYKQRNDDNIDEGVTLTGSSIINDEENDLKYSSHYHTHPRYVHKD
ncbi:unnamed protein product [Rotaria sp. Silwood1]|nr:unnamed protein product [Rotaria sp. Silwood1]CAF3807630.1 unnamed protein product [Rotaria sp. Silwood1]CAF4715847.1 unnamed protein product [Rotaria sp. Silwood1]CAF4737238.1 unnamed protein product [Rotaria sp. Silwood1]